MMARSFSTHQLRRVTLSTLATLTGVGMMGLSLAPVTPAQAADTTIPLAQASVSNTAAALTQNHLTTPTVSTRSRVAAPTLKITNISPAVLAEDSKEIAITVAMDLTGTGWTEPSARAATQVVARMSPASTIHRQTLLDWVDGKTDYVLGRLAVIARKPLTEVVPEAQLQTRADSHLTTTFTLKIPRSELHLADSSQWGPRGITVNLVNHETGEETEARSLLNIAPAAKLEVKPGPLVLLAPLTARPAPLTPAAELGANAPKLSKDAQALSDWPLTPLSDAPTPTAVEVSEETAASADKASTKASASAQTTDMSKDEAQQRPTSGVGKNDWPAVKFGNGWAIWLDPALLAENSYATMPPPRSEAFAPQLNQRALQACKKWKAEQTELIASLWGMPNNGILNNGQFKTQSTLSIGNTKTVLAQLNTHEAITNADISVHLNNTATLSNTDSIQVYSDRQFPLPYSAVFHPGAHTTTSNIQVVNRSGVRQAALSENVIRKQVQQASAAAEQKFNDPAVPTDPQTQLLLTDSAIAQQLQLAVTNPEDEFTHLQVARGFLAMKTRERPQDPRSTVINLPSLTANPRSYDLGNALLHDPWVQPSSLTQLAESVPSHLSRLYYLDSREQARLVGTQGDGTVPNSLSAQNSDADIFASANAKRLATEVASVDNKTAALAQNLSQHHDTLAPLYQRLSLWSLSTANDVTSLQHLRSLSEAGNNSLHQAVSVSTLPTANIISRDSHIPLTVKNHLKQPVQVDIAVDASDSRVQIPKPTKVTVAATSSQTTKIPIKAVGNGVVTLRIKATSTTGTQVSNVALTRLNIHAGIESVGLKVLGIAVAAIFIVSLTLNVLKSKRYRDLRRLWRQKSK